MTEAECRMCSSVVVQRPDPDPVRKVDVPQQTTWKARYWSHSISTVPLFPFVFLPYLRLCMRTGRNTADVLENQQEEGGAEEIAAGHLGHLIAHLSDSSQSRTARRLCHGDIVKLDSAIDPTLK